MSLKYPGGVWPVMLTPFTAKGEVDTEALTALVDWYIDSGVKGLFGGLGDNAVIKNLTLVFRYLLFKLLNPCNILSAGPELKVKLHHLVRYSSGELLHRLHYEACHALQRRRI